ncbi:MAG: branched-chain amino acid ABC transporter permease [Acidimicrobiia bacterium]|nr:branched-chain amino acid ABC transporter permease [Acidimicrobiia bacterium]
MTAARRSIGIALIAVAVIVVVIPALDHGTDATRFADATVSGLKNGLIIAVTAIGLSLIYGTTGLVNFAHGELVTMGAVIAWYFNNPVEWGGHVSLWIGGLIAVVVVGLFGGGLELGLWRPLRRRRAGLIQMLVVSIGLSLLLRSLIQVFYGANRNPFYDYNVQNQFAIWRFSAPPRVWAIIIIAAAVVVGVGMFLTWTRYGKAMRAVADNNDLAESTGIDVNGVILLVWITGAGLAALGGVLQGLGDGAIAFDMGFRLLLLMFAAIILGGLGSAYGALAGGLVIGMVIEWSTIWLPGDLKLAWAMALMVGILLIRPQGLLGRAERFG